MKVPLLFSVLLLAPPALAEDVDLEVVHRIKQEAFLNSKVMDYIHLIADENGPRMSGSPAYRRAADAAVAAFRAAGIEKAAIEPSGHFGRGWDWTRVAVQMKTPQETTLSAYPADWSSGTDGPVSGEVVFAPVWEHPDDVPTNGDIEKLAHQIEGWKDKYRGQLRGKVVMMDHPAPWKLPAKPEQFRASDENLAAGTVTSYDGDVDPGPVPTLEWPLVAYPVDKEERSRIWDVMPLEFAADRWALQVKIGNRISTFLREEGAAAVLLTGAGPRAGVIMHSDFGSYLDDDPIPPPSVVLMPEHYNRIYRLLKREVLVEVEVDVDAEFYPAQQGL
ncbi:MAG: hypothetical protein JRD03_05155, partial [Deltaproteobacteria bacterium]|nr:hypothetical protein [Deltaproteobacteria bacterium]